jgi:hypothetical protein
VDQFEQRSVQRRSKVFLVYSLIAHPDDYRRPRHLLLAEAAKKIEYSVHTMSATESGYNQRAKAKLHVVKLMEHRESLWSIDAAHYDDDEEEAIEIIGLLRNICSGWRKIGKRKAL